MISDDDLYKLALFLGSAAMILIVVYHFLDVNAKGDEIAAEKAATKVGGRGQTSGKQGAATR